MNVCLYFNVDLIFKLRSAKVSVNPRQRENTLETRPFDDKYMYMSL